MRPQKENTTLKEKEIIKMTRDIRDIRNENIGHNCNGGNSSLYTMAAVAGCLLLCVGIIIYALIGA